MSALSDPTALQVANLTKVYFKGQSNDELLALDSISFEVNEGEILGVIGANGAGKSTLLKILSEITAPTSGEITYHGRLTSILDVGTGFHPDLSGQENIFLNGSILGYSKVEIEKALAEILAFSGLEEFIHMPVKQYSSGMYLRLAFSVAFHFDMDILILDEILAVGDAEFRQKCLAVMKQLIQKGKTIIMVSHNIEIVTELCSRTIWLEKGKIKKVGATLSVVEAYLGIGKPLAESFKGLDFDDFNISRATINEGAVVKLGDAVTIDFTMHKFTEKDSVQIMLHIYNSNNFQLLSDCEELRLHRDLPLKAGLYDYNIEIPAGWMSPGRYTVHLTVTRNYHDMIHPDVPFATFIVEADPSQKGNKMNGMTGSIHPVLQWKTNYRHA